MLAQLIQKRWRGGGWAPGRCQKNLQMQMVVPHNRKASSVFEDLRKFAKRWDITKKTYYSSFYQAPNQARERKQFERAYFHKWHYLKYCTQVIKYGAEHKLLMGVPIDENDENRLNISVKPVEAQKKDGLSHEEILRIASEFYGDQVCPTV